MKRILVCISFLFAFGHFMQAQNFTPEVKAERLKQLVTNGFKVESVKISHDTLKVVLLDDFLFYPFGRIKNMDAFINRTKLEWYRSVDRFKYQDSLDMTIYKLWRLDDSFIEFFYGIETHNMEMIEANITDKAINLSYGIHCGMAKQELLNLFFKTPPPVLIGDIKCVRFVSGLYELQHCYTFDDQDILRQIYIEREYKYR